MSDLKLFGEVPDDPRIKEAIEKIQNSGDDGITEAITYPESVGLEKYGIKFRKIGLMQSAMIAQIVSRGGEIPRELQIFIWIFTLGAPLEKVYAALGKLKDGFPKFMVDVHEWYESSGIPQDVSEEVLSAINESFELAGKMAPKSTLPEEDGVLKKNPLPGTQLPQTES